MESILITNNEKEQQFQVRVDGEMAYLEYRQETPRAFRLKAHH